MHMRPVPTKFSATWWLGTAANVFACTLSRLPRWMCPMWLDRLAEQACMRHDWREDPLF